MAGATDSSSGSICREHKKESVSLELLPGPRKATKFPSRAGTLLHWSVLLLLLYSLAFVLSVSLAPATAAPRPSQRAFLFC